MVGSKHTIGTGYLYVWYEVPVCVVRGTCMCGTRYLYVWYEVPVCVVCGTCNTRTTLAGLAGKNTLFL